MLIEIYLLLILHLRQFNNRVITAIMTDLHSVHRVIVPQTFLSILMKLYMF